MKAVSQYQLPVSSIVIECPFGTMLQTVKNRFHSLNIPTFLMANLLVFWGGMQNGFNAFTHNPEAYAREIRCPTLLMYGVKDLKVTKQEIETIYNNLPGQKELVTFPEAGNENYLRRYKKEWTKEVEEALL